MHAAVVRSRRFSVLHACLLLSAIGLGLLPARANPTGAQVQAGTCAFDEALPGRLSIRASDRAIINWQDFSIAAGEATRFIQPCPGASVLNRVLGGSLSRLDGLLVGNGRVFLLNPNGVLFGAGAVVDTAGFVASTLDADLDRFLATGDLQLAGPSLEAVVNLGSITAQSGDVFLIARSVENRGSISAPGGAAVLAAGGEVLLSAADDDAIMVQPGLALGGGGVVNAGTIASARAELLAAGGNPYALAVNNQGMVSATTLVGEGGRILLKADGGASVNAGTLQADGSHGGSVAVLGANVDLQTGSVTSASGRDGGGTVLVGGDYQGANPAVPNAASTTVAAGAVVRADASGECGDGGRVVFWSDAATDFGGTASAHGGSESGAGGFMEISSRGTLALTGTADVSGLSAGGTVLLDPVGIVIRSRQQRTPNVNGDDVVGDDLTGHTELGSADTYPDAYSFISTEALVLLLDGNIRSKGGGVVGSCVALAASDYIGVYNDVVWDSDSSLFFSTGGDVFFNADVFSNNGDGQVVVMGNPEIHTDPDVNIDWGAFGSNPNGGGDDWADVDWEEFADELAGTGDDDWGDWDEWEDGDDGNAEDEFWDEWAEAEEEADDDGGGVRPPTGGEPALPETEAERLAREAREAAEAAQNQAQQAQQAAQAAQDQEANRFMRLDEWANLLRDPGFNSRPEEERKAILENVQRLQGEWDAAQANAAAQQQQAAQAQQAAAQALQQAEQRAQAAAAAAAAEKARAEQAARDQAAALEQLRQQQATEAAIREAERRAQEAQQAAAEAAARAEQTQREREAAELARRLAEQQAQAAQQQAQAEQQGQPSERRETALTDNNIGMEQPTWGLGLFNREATPEEVQKAVNLSLLGFNGEKVANSGNLALQTAAQVERGELALQTAEEVAWGVMTATLDAGMTGLANAGPLGEQIKDVFDEVLEKIGDVQEKLDNVAEAWDAVQELMREKGLEVNKEIFQGTNFTLTRVTTFNTVTREYVTQYIRTPGGSSGSDSANALSRALIAASLDEMMKAIGGQVSTVTVSGRVDYQ